MTDYTNAVVKPGHRVHHTPDKEEIVSTSTDGVVKMRTTQYEEALALGAVRKSTKADREAEVAQAGQPQATLSVEQVATLTSKHRGGGRFDIVNGDTLIETGFESKDAADARIVEMRAAASN